jgi:DNA polymerase III epsilon subunit-like protein
MAWHDGRLTAIDLETTSVDVETARIVQFAVGYVGGGEPTQMYSEIVNPGVEIPDGAAGVHGITTERARAEGIPTPEAIGVIVMYIGRAIEQGWPLVGFNLGRFDLTIIDRECRRNALTPPDWDRARVVDVFVLWKWADRFRRGSRNLAACCEAYGVELGDAHDAGADALASARLAWVMMHKADLVQRRWDEVAAARGQWKRVRGDLDALHAMQVTVAREQAISLREYFASKGRHEDAASVREAWPVEPLPALS